MHCRCSSIARASTLLLVCSRANHRHRANRFFIVAAASSCSSSSSSSSATTRDAVREKRNEQNLRLQRFYVDRAAFNSATFSLSKEDSRHALKSLRLKIDDRIECCDGQGRIKVARLREVDARKTEATFEMESEDGEVFFQPFPGRMKWDVVVACAGIKGGRSDWLVEKLTELNGRTLVPLLTSRSGKIGSASTSSGGKSSNSKRRKDEEEEEETGKELRWQRVALAASKQSLRAHVFEIEKPVSFSDLVSSKYFSDATCRFVAAAGGADFAEKLRGVRESISSNGNDSSSENKEKHYGLIIIGPEGDFDDDEMKALMDTCETISLGDLRLRTETAAIASLSIAQMITNA
jgi:16S rRNA (uracil1498-N3)-methyltransferase